MYFAVRINCPKESYNHYPTNLKAKDVLILISRLFGFVFFNQELSDLHIEALAVLGNCLEDVYTLQLIQLTGGLKKLLSFLAVSTVPGIQKNAAKAITKAAYDGM